MKYSRLFGVCAAIAAGSALASPAQAANLLGNGSFETGNYVNGGGGYEDLTPGSTAITDWSIVGSGTLAWIGPGYAGGLSPEDGSYFLDLTGTTDAPPYTGVTQTITTTPGQTYDLSFYLGSSSIYGVPDSIQASAGGKTETFQSTLSGANNWQLESMSFVATSNNTLVSLLGETANNEYIGLDNVSVAAVPEPATWTMTLFGLFSAGALLRMARRKKALTLTAD
jgi:hypothetical protein